MSTARSSRSPARARARAAARLSVLPNEPIAPHPPLAAPGAAVRADLVDWFARNETNNVSVGRAVVVQAGALELLRFPVQNLTIRALANRTGHGAAARRLADSALLEHVNGHLARAPLLFDWTRPGGRTGLQFALNPAGGELFCFYNAAEDYSRLPPAARAARALGVPPELLIGALALLVATVALVAAVYVKNMHYAQPLQVTLASLRDEL